MNLKFYFKTVLSGFLMLQVCTGFSQSLDSIKNYLIDEVMITATRTEKKVMDIPKGVTLITKEEIKNSGATNLSELLRTQENLCVIGSNQTPGTNQSFFLRGMGSDQTVVMVDGIRISDPSSNSNSVDLSEISLIDISCVEIVRGAHSTLYGSSAIGGVINLITEKNLKPGLNIRANVDAGTFGKETSQINEILNLNYSFNKGLYVGTKIFHSNAKGLDAALDTVTTEGAFKNNDRDDFTKTDIVAKIGFINSKINTFLSIKTINQFSDIDYNAFINDENNTIKLKRNLINYSLNYKLNNNFIIWFNGGGSIVNRTNENDSSLTAPGVYDRNYYIGTFRGSLINNELQLNYTANNFKLAGGGGIYYEKMTSDSYTYSGMWNYESVSDLDTLKLHSIISNLYVSADVNGKIISDKLAPFSLWFGLRFNSDSRSNRYMTYEINPYYKFSEKSILFGSISTGFNSPSLYKLYTPESYYISGITRGNSKLEPEKSFSTELGLKQTIGKNIIITFSGYRNIINNTIQYVYLWDKEIGIDTLGMDWMRDDYRGDTYLNLGKLTTCGAEFSLSAKIGKNFTLRGNLNLQKGSLNFKNDDIDVNVTQGNHVQIFESGRFINEEADINKLTRRTNNINLFIGYSITKSSNIGFNVNHVGRKNDIFYSANIMPYGALDYKSLSSYTICNISFAQQLNKYLSGSLRIQNLFNEKYTELLGYSTRGRGIFLNLDFSI